jgi:hypothetical protein
VLDQAVNGMPDRTARQATFFDQLGKLQRYAPDERARLSCKSVEHTAARHTDRTAVARSLSLGLDIEGHRDPVDQFEYIELVLIVVLIRVRHTAS